MKVIFTCGGTAGHVNPALALAQYMHDHLAEKGVRASVTHRDITKN